MFWLLSKEFVTHTEFWVLNAKLSCLTKASICRWDIVCVYIQFLVAYNLPRSARYKIDKPRT